MQCIRPLIVGRHTFGCGQCMPCRIQKRELWTNRLLLEAKCHAESCFVTLTYDDERVPVSGSGLPTLRPEHLSGWLKRLRERYRPERFRFFSCGEYGDETFRPHYHAALFGYAWCRGGPYKFVSYGVGREGKECQCKSCLDVRESWGFGFISLSAMEPSRAAYIAKYVIKKMTSPGDSRLNGRVAEFARMSLRPGIGALAMGPVASAAKGWSAESRTVPMMGVGKGRFYIGRYLKGKLYEELGSQPVESGGIRALEENADRLRLLRMVAGQCNVSVEELLGLLQEQEETGYRPKGAL